MLLQGYLYSPSAVHPALLRLLPADSRLARLSDAPNHTRPSSLRNDSFKP